MDPYRPWSLTNIKPYQFEPRVGDPPVQFYDSEGSDCSEDSDWSDSSDEEEKTFCDEPERVGNTDWCDCGNCKDMPTAPESHCCKEVPEVEQKAKEKGKSCICDHPGFQVVCLNRTVVEVALKEFVSIDGPIGDDEPIHEIYRNIAHRQFIFYIWHKMGKRNKRVPPACAVNKIKEAFPTEETSGFKYERP